MAEGSIKRGKGVCEACGKARGWVYARPVFGEGDSQRTICPWCIADGAAAAELKITFNDPGIYPMLPGVAQLSSTDREAVESRTPGFETWQDHGWMMCCGRACVYLGEASAEDLAGRWAEAAPSIVAECEGWSEDEKKDLIQNITKKQGPCAYVFECQVCRKLKGFWDIH